MRTETSQQNIYRSDKGDCCTDTLFVQPQKETGLDEQRAIQFTIGAIQVKFKIDTGVDANIMGQETFNKLTPKMEIKPNVTMCSPGGHLVYLGKFQAIIKYKEKLLFLVYVRSGQNTNNVLRRNTTMKTGQLNT